MKTIFKNAFIIGALITSVIAVTPATYATEDTTCIDGSNKSNLTVTWVSNSEVTIAPKNAQPLCNDVELHFSSYSMPENYNGGPFSGNPTATPQTLFDDAPVLMKKGSTATQTAKIDLPDACLPTQVDVYYAPLLEVVKSGGHGGQLLSGHIVQASGEPCEEPEVPVTPPTDPEPPVTPITPEVPVELPKTGPSNLIGVAITAILSIGTYLGVYFTAKRR